MPEDTVFWLPRFFGFRIVTVRDYAVGIIVRGMKEQKGLLRS